MTETQTLSHTSSLDRIVVDCAGAVKGGAARLLREVQAYLSETRPSNVELIGVGQRLTSKWLIQREILAASAKRRISLNNAGFLNPRGENVTLLHNILQFATAEDLEKLSFERSRRLKVQTPIIRALAKSSKTLVVPCTRMAQQVEMVTPGLKDKLVVRFHPISKPNWAGTPPKRPRDILLPIVPAPYKNLDQHLPEFLEASEGLPGGPVRLIVPSEPDSFPELASHPRVKFIGLQSSEELDLWWRDSGAVFFPTEFEAFGFPLAEAQVYGRSAIAQDTDQNRELAGHSLHPYDRHSHNSLRNAIETATIVVPIPDPDPFIPSSYFEWLLD
ncbi:MAG: hypothetical protein L0I94_10765 [Yaniella sp.]|nr:hypothetical protein [Yaniella sp.]MDN6679916.1 hypothetical protein [Yaniella sp.]